METIDPMNSLIPIYTVDAFTREPFKGNPAAVCVLKNAVPEEWMQKIAMEMNLAETAFVFPHKKGFNLRWFTPQIEVDLCGHATLASAHTLWEADHLTPEEPIIFYTKSGKLTARKEGTSIVLDFPSVLATPMATPKGLAEILGVKIIQCAKNRMDILVEVSSPEEVLNCQPDLIRLKNFPVRGIIVTSTSHLPGADFISRFFAPAAGIDEDPVTGSAHCCLAPWWAKRMDKNKMMGYQASPRGGWVGVELKGKRVELIGDAVTVLRGYLSA